MPFDKNTKFKIIGHIDDLDDSREGDLVNCMVENNLFVFDEIAKYESWNYRIPYEDAAYGAEVTLNKLIELNMIEVV